MRLVFIQDKELQAIAALNQWGVPFLSSPFEIGTEPPLELTELLKRMIQSDSARLRLGVTAFFLVHSEQAPAVVATSILLEEGPRKLLKYYYTAAVYLQRLWRNQLSGFGEGALPDYFSKELALPVPDLKQARLGLASLEEALQHIAHEPYNYMASFDSLIRLLQQEGKFRETARQS